MNNVKQRVPFPFEADEANFVPDLLPYMDAPQNIQLLTGNRGSGKSIFKYQKAIIFCLTKKYFRLVFCRKNAVDIRDSIFQGFIDIINEWNLKEQFHIKETEMDIVCKLNGNRMLSFGLDKPTKLKSIKDPSHVLVEELTEVSFEDYSQLIALLRTTKVKNTQFWGLFNPEFSFWGREYFFLDSESDEIPLGEVPPKTDNTLILKTTFENNPFIDADKYRKKLLELARGDQNKYTVWVDGNWGQAVTGNEYFPHFNKAVHVGKVPFLRAKPVHLTYDFNAVPFMSQLCWQVNITETEFELRLFGEYCLKSPLNSTEAVCKAFLADYKESITDLLFYGDSSGNSRIAGKGNATAFDDVEKVFYRYLTGASKRVLKHNPSVLKRRDFMNDILLGKIKYNGKTVRIMIDESCKETIEDFTRLKLGIDGKMKERITDRTTGMTYERRSHATDASEYFIIRLLWDLFNQKDRN